MSTWVIVAVALFAFILLGLISYDYYRRRNILEDSVGEENNFRKEIEPTSEYRNTDTSMLVAMYTIFKESNKDRCEEVAEELHRRGLKEIDTDSEVVQWVKDDSCK